MSTFRQGRPPLSLQKQLVFTLATGLFVSGVVILAAEFAARAVRGYRLFSWTLINSTDESTGPGFYEPNKLKIWNSQYVMRNAARFEDWPYALDQFSDDDVHPHYLFRSNLAITRRGNRLLPAGPGDAVCWRSNEHGMRGETVGEKRPGVTRVVCLGESTTEGSQGEDETYPALLQRQLDKRFGPTRFQVLNGGHHGYNAGDCVAFLEMVIGDIKPDIVIWYQAANDIYAPSWVENWPKFESLKRRWNGRATRYSALVNLCLARYDDWSRKPVSHVFINDPNNESLVRWEGSLRRFVSVCRAANAVPVICSYSTILHAGLEWDRGRHPQVDHWVRYYWPLTPGEVAQMYAIYNERGRTVARELDCLYVDVAANMPRTHQVFWDFVHYHPFGNKLLAQYIANGIAPVTSELIAGSTTATQTPTRR